MFNTPAGRYKNPRIIDEDNLYRLSYSLPKINNILNTQFDKIQSIEKGDLVYFDPPYHPISDTSAFTSYNSCKFSIDEQIRLRDFFKKLNDKGVYLILSNSSSDFIKNIYKDFNIVKVQCKRRINSNPNKRGKITELLVIGDEILRL